MTAGPLPFKHPQPPAGHRPDPSAVVPNNTEVAVHWAGVAAGRMPPAFSLCCSLCPTVAASTWENSRGCVCDCCPAAYPVCHHPVFARTHLKSDPSRCLGLGAGLSPSARPRLKPASARRMPRQSMSNNHRRRSSCRNSNNRWMPLTFLLRCSLRWQLLWTPQHTTTSQQVSGGFLRKVSSLGGPVLLVLA